MGLELIIIIAGLILDRISKIWAVNTLEGKEDIVVIKDIFSFSHLQNRGAAFGIFQNKVYMLAIVTSIVILAMIYYMIKHRPKSRLLRISMALVISGAIGNLIDRVVYKYVVDFIMLHYKDVYYFPTFNVADMCVVFGTILLALCIIKDEV
jgi:signal peptidase II